MFLAHLQRAVFEDGALPAKVKQLIAVAVAHVTQCPYCIQGQTRAHPAPVPAARNSWKRFGRAEMRAGAALAHALLTLDTVEKKERSRRTVAPPPAAATL